MAEDLNNNFNTVAPRIFIYDREGPRSRKITEGIKKLYLNNQPVSNATQAGVGQLYADTYIIYPQVEAAKLFAEKSSEPVYMYLFSYVGQYSFRYSPGTNTPLGAVHHDELLYIMYVSQNFPEFKDTDPEVHMVYTLTKTFTEFAETGVPTLPDPNIKWTPLSPQNLQYLEIGNDVKTHPIAGISLKMVSGVPFPKRMEFWESVFTVSGPHHQVMY